MYRCVFVFQCLILVFVVLILSSFVDQFSHAVVDTFRGTDWRGRDCNDLDKTVYPGRAATTQPVGGGHLLSHLLISPYSPPLPPLLLLLPVFY